MRKLILQLVSILLILFISTLVISCQQNDQADLSSGEKEAWSPTENEAGWTLFTNCNEIKKIITTGKSLWAATSGGAVKWDMDKGTYCKYITRQ